MAFVLALLSVLALLPQQVAAAQSSGTLNISAHTQYGWEMDIMIPSEIDYNISTLNGSRINVLVLDQANYTRYSQNQSFEYIPQYSFLNVTAAAANMTVLSGSVFLVVDNAANPYLTQLPPQGSADIQFWIGTAFAMDSVPDYGYSWAMYVLAAVFGALFVLVILFMRKAIKQYRKEKRD